MTCRGDVPGRRLPHELYAVSRTARFSPPLSGQ